jgi:hypothetical protein
MRRCADALLAEFAIEPVEFIEVPASVDTQLDNSSRSCIRPLMFSGFSRFLLSSDLLMVSGNVQSWYQLL